MELVTEDYEPTPTEVLLVKLLTEEDGYTSAWRDADGNLTLQIDTTIYEKDQTLVDLVHLFLLDLGLTVEDYRK
jgi:hypothetical protein